MKKEDLFNELGNIDKKYIEEAEVKKPAIKRYTAIAAAFLLAAVAIGTSDTAQAEIKKLFKFIPGMTIEQNTDSSNLQSGILYSMDGESVTKTDGKSTITLLNTYVTDKTVDIVYKVSFDFINEDNLIDKNDFSSNLKKYCDEANLDYIKLEDVSDDFPFLSVNEKVSINGKEYKTSQSGGGSTTKKQLTVRVDGIDKEIEQFGVNLPINMTIGNMSFDIKLKPIETYENIEEIGPTAVKNNISLTAMPRWDGDMLYIKMYNLNYSEFTQVYGYVQHDRENGDILPYLLIGDQKIPSIQQNGDGTEFYFDLSSYNFSDEQKAAAKFCVPVVIVLNNENKVLEFIVNKDDTIDFPKEFNLKYADLAITNMTVGTEDWDESIGIEFTSKNKDEKIDLDSVDFFSINGKYPTGTWVLKEGNSWSAAFGTDDIKDIHKYHSVTVSSVMYAINDEYVFSLE